ncbi:hypothetical protein [Nocardia gamkensis]|uniref:hypothetical protein n=1 Tax=Nocardia gamkensis TaxID=352869 RepID=UPI0037C968B2
MEVAAADVGLVSAVHWVPVGDHVDPALGMAGKLVEKGDEHLRGERGRESASTARVHNGPSINNSSGV